VDFYSGAMSGGNRPRLFRSADGCCVCGAKSSSSRFTESVRYENNFEQCFGLDPVTLRSTEICNACVLLVKRYRRLPVGAKRSWPHVVGARAGPGLKSMLRIKNRQTPSHDSRTVALTTVEDLIVRSTKAAVLTSTSRRNLIFKCQQPLRRSPGLHWSVGGATSWPRPHSINNGFIDVSYWTSKQVCCGTIFVGQYNDILVDTQLLNLCSIHRHSLSLPFQPVPLTQQYSLPDTLTLLCPSTSVDSGNVSPSSVDELTDDAESESSPELSQHGAAEPYVGYMGPHRATKAYCGYMNRFNAAIELNKSLSTLHQRHATSSSSSRWPAPETV
jgi:hypothetical protein